MSQLNTEEDSLDYKNNRNQQISKNNNEKDYLQEMKASLTWNMEAPYGVRHALSKLSLPVDTNHLPHVAKRNESTHDSCRCSWYLSGLRACNTSTLEFSMPTANHSPVGQ